MTLAMPAFLIDRCGGTAARRSDGRGNVRNASPASGTGCGNRPDLRLPGLEDPCRALAGEPGKEDHAGPSVPGRDRPGHARTAPIPPFAGNATIPGRRPAAGRAHTEPPPAMTAPSRTDGQAGGNCWLHPHVPSFVTFGG